MNRKLILTTAAVLFISLTTPAQYSYLTGFPVGSPSNLKSRDLRYDVRPRYTRPVKQGKMNEAKFLHDFIDGYPANWVTDYVSVEILATCNGNVRKAVSTNDRLSTEQKNILNTVDLSTDIVTIVKYKYKNSVTDNSENHEMYISMTVIPDIEAEYFGGYPQMTKYLKGNIIDKISETTHRLFQEGIVIFTVNEEGEIVNAKISKTSGDPETDKLLVEAINKMPKWRPAKNSKGIKVKQEFEFHVGAGLEGC